MIQVIGNFFTKYEKAAKYAAKLSAGEKRVIIVGVKNDRMCGWIVYLEEQFVE